MNSIRISLHAIEHIQVRHLTQEFVESVVRNPRQITGDEDNPNRKIFQSLVLDKKNLRKIIRVVVEETEDELVVVAGHLLKLKKYFVPKAHPWCDLCDFSAFFVTK